MTKRKLKGYVLPTLYLICISIIIISMTLISRNLQPTNDFDNDYVTDIVTEETTPVVDTVSIIRPYANEAVNTSIKFYDKDSTESEQEKSLIYYENTYLQNSGVVYTNQEDFEAIAVLDGTIMDIKQDEILNTVVYISHNNNLTTVYYGLKNVNLKINDSISQGETIGLSTNNKFSTEPSSMLFEVNYNGQVINPENFYTMDISDLN